EDCHSGSALARVDRSRIVRSNEKSRRRITADRTACLGGRFAPLSAPGKERSLAGRVCGGRSRTLRRQGKGKLRARTCSLDRTRAIGRIARKSESFAADAYGNGASAHCDSSSSTQSAWPPALAAGVTKSWLWLPAKGEPLTVVKAPLETSYQRA